MSVRSGAPETSITTGFAAYMLVSAKSRKCVLVVETTGSDPMNPVSAKLLRCAYPKVLAYSRHN
jgi:hypothetical protein